MGIAAEGTMIHFVDARNEQATTDLPKPEYLALLSAVAGILHMSGADEAIEKVLDDAEHISVLASDGFTALAGLFLVH